MSGRIPVHVEATDPVSCAGVASQLRSRPELLVVDDVAEASVGVVVADELDDRVATLVRARVRGGLPRVLIVLARVDDHAVLAAAEAGAQGIVRRSEATPELLAESVTACSSGAGAMSPDLVGRLLRQVGRLQRDVLAPRGLGPHGLSEREIAVLRMVADGNDTREIAKELAYSERTVKNVIHDVVTKLNLRNRPHAVAFAVREGII
jgi:DNA-binding NarL/FixJ family response regulator